jgi:hypothetical protein
LRRSSRSTELVAGLLGLALLSWSAPAFAQACCAGGGAYAPARLKLYEDGLVGVQMKVVDGLGSFDGNLHYSNNPPGDSEVDLEEDVLGAYRINEHAQVGAVIPVVETGRVESGLSGFGGGLGDITVNARYDFILPANEKNLPGIAMVAGLTFPTGRAPDQAKTPLAVDATGTGYWQGGLGLAVEQLFGRWVLDAGISIWGSLPRTVEGITEQLGPQIAGRFAFGYGFRNGAALAFTLVYNGATTAYINHAPVPGGAPGLMTAGIAAGWPINYQWRLQAAISDDLPVLGRNHVAGIGVTATVLRTF